MCRLSTLTYLHLNLSLFAKWIMQVMACGTNGPLNSDAFFIWLQCPRMIQRRTYRNVYCNVPSIGVSLALPVDIIIIIFLNSALIFFIVQNFNWISRKLKMLAFTTSIRTATAMVWRHARAPPPLDFQFREIHAAFLSCFEQLLKVCCLKFCCETAGHFSF